MFGVEVSFSSQYVE